MSATPYWGHLPNPKIATHKQLTPDDDDQVSLDGQQPGTTGTYQRASVQTTHTEAATDVSTFSPFQSPTASSFAPHGLAPRPASYQRPIGAEFAAEPTGRSSRRKSRGGSRTIDSEALPAASEASSRAAPATARAPTTSHRHPHDGGTQPPANTSTAPVPIDNLELGASASAADMDPNEAYQASHHGYAAPATDQPRRVGPERRKKSAVAKSPLQKLELTLDSMTKEEKRARVMAAERRARERQARKASEAQPEQPAVFGQASEVPVKMRSQPQVSSAPAPPAPMAQDLAQQRDVSSREVSAIDAPRPRREHPEENGYDRRVPPPQEQQPLPAEQIHADLPKRNLSFRERAARNEVKFPGIDEDSNSAGSPGSFPLVRSGSNKLRKDPPDAWYQRQANVDRSISVTKPEYQTGNSQTLPKQRGPVSRAARDKELPPDPPVSDAKSSAAFAAHRRHQSLSADDHFQSVQRRATDPVRRRPQELDDYNPPEPQQRKQQATLVKSQPPAHNVGVLVNQHDTSDEDCSSDESAVQQTAAVFAGAGNGLKTGKGVYQPPHWLDEWKKATVGSLAGSLLNVSADPASTAPATSQQDQDTAWWEDGGRRRSSYPSKPRKAEAYEGEYDNSNAPTRFKPQLYLECGPLLRYCGIRQEKVPGTSHRSGAATERQMWRGTIMIVTRDSESLYEISPTLRLFVQDIALLPKLTGQLNGAHSPEYDDPIAGHPKLGRRGQTLYVRPVDYLEECKDLSHIETDGGLFETIRSPLDTSPPDGSDDYPGSFASRAKRIEVDGEKVQKFKDVRGFRLHTERGCTFWRFNISIELRDRQQRIAYRINRGPSMAFWVPARGKAMNMMFHSCNGFSDNSKANAMSGPDPMWRDVLNTHQTSPFHVMIGGGDQIYNDAVAEECDLFAEWMELRDPSEKRTAPFTPQLQRELENFYFRRYCKWFSQGLFGLANSQIPMVNMGSDREIFNGFGSFSHQDMSSHVLSGLGAVAFKYYMLFQHQSIIPETEEAESTWILGTSPGPYINELSRSIYMSLGSKVSLLAADCRTERTENEVIKDKTWEKIMNRLYAEVRRGQLDHLLVVLPVPIAYPRLAWLENVFTSRVMNPVKTLSKKGLLGKAFNKLEEGGDVLDDLSDHWTAKNHIQERSIVMEDLQDLAIDKSLRITILSGDVNMAAVGQFYSNPKLGLAKHKDPRYMPNIISSAIVNAPPPDLMADALNRRHKVHHFDKQTDECMIPMFQHGVDGKPRNNQRLLPHRNWCAIHQWEPGSTPPPTPPESIHEDSPDSSGGLGGRIMRRLSRSGSQQRPDLTQKESIRGPRPPVSGGGGLFRSISRSISRRRSEAGERPKVLTRSMSVGRADTQKPGFFSRFTRRNSHDQPDDGGINGHWGADSDDDYDDLHFDNRQPRPSGLRGGAAQDEYSEGDEEFFTVRAPQQRPQAFASHAANDPNFTPKPFHRTPTGLSTKQMRKAEHLQVDLEGGLDVCLNVEVNPKDPTGITVPYRLLVPKLVYEYVPEAEASPVAEATGFKKLLSFRKKPAPKQEEREWQEEEEEEEEEEESSDEDFDDAREAGIQRR